jgi:hypothetical protein
MTPHDLYSLFKDQANAMQRNPGLFGEQRQEAVPEAAAEAVAETPSRIGSLGRHRSAPPTH